MSTTAPVKEYADLNAAVSALGTSGTTTLTISTALPVTASIIVPATLALQFTGDGSLTVPTGMTVTINGPMVAPIKKIFSLTGTAKVVFGPGSTATLYPQWWGAVADGVFDSAPAINAALSAFSTTANGLEVLLAAGVYRIDSTIQIPATALVLRGQGYTANVSAVFGNAGWVGPNGVLGTVLKATSITAPGIRVDANLSGATTASCAIRDLAILGPGSGSSSGLVIGSATVVGAYFKCENVGIFNFSIGLNLLLGNSNTFHMLDIRGCSTGISSANFAVQEIGFYYLYIKFCGTGISITNGSHMDFYNLIAQNCGTAVSLAPVGQIEGYSFFGCFWESNTTNVLMNVATAGILRVVFDHCNMSGAGAFTFTGAGTHSLLGLHIRACNFGSLDFTVPGGMSESVIETTQFNSFATNLNSWAAGVAVRALRLNTSPFKIDSLQSSYPFAAVPVAGALSLIWANGSVQTITVTAPTTITMPTTAPSGAILTLVIKQDVAGGRTVTFSGFNHTSWPPAGSSGGSNTTSTIQAYCNGTEWTQIGAQSPWMS